MNFTIEETEYITGMYREGVSSNDIAAHLGLHKSHIVALLRAEGVPLRYRRITEDQACEMVGLYRARLTGPEIAQRFKTTAPSVYHALQRHGIERRPRNNGYVTICKHKFFHRIDTEAKAYLLGGIAADGNVSRQNEVSISLKATDIEMVRRFGQELGIANPVRIDERVKVFRGYRFKYRRAVVSVTSARMSSDLAEYGVIPAKTGRTVPAAVPEQVPARLERHYWRGWVDMDGWVCPDFTREAESSVGRRQLLLGLTGDLAVVDAFRRFCLRHVPSRALIHPNHNVKRFVVTDSYAARIASILYRGATIALNRKARSYESWRLVRPEWCG